MNYEKIDKNSGVNLGNAGPRGAYLGANNMDGGNVENSIVSLLYFRQDVIHFDKISIADVEEKK